jgi:5'-nucleotidase
MQAQSSRRYARALLTNDDGVDAPGIQALAEVAAEIADEVWIVAPEHDQSGASRSVGLHAPLRVLEKGTRRFAINGTPADCVIMGLRRIMADAPPDIVLSGINRGANIGDEVGYSGTVGAAMTARLMGVPALALSQAFRDPSAVRWATAKALLPRALAALDEAPAIPGVPNINFPDVDAGEVTGVEFTRQSQGGMISIDVEGRRDMRGRDYAWLSFRRHPSEQPDDSDVSALRRKAVSITPLGFDMTDTAALKALRGA